MYFKSIFLALVVSFSFSGVAHSQFDPNRPNGEGCAELHQDIEAIKACLKENKQEEEAQRLRQIRIKEAATAIVNRASKVSPNYDFSYFLVSPRTGTINVSSQDIWNRAVGKKKKFIIAIHDVNAALKGGCTFGTATFDSWIRDGLGSVGARQNDRFFRKGEYKASGPFRTHLRAGNFSSYSILIVGIQTRGPFEAANAETFTC